MQGEPGSFLGLEGGLKGKENGYPGGIFDPLGFSKYALGPACYHLTWEVARDSVGAERSLPCVK